MSQEVAAVTAAKYVNEVTVGGVTRYQACVHGCSSDVRDTHHEAVKDARRMLQSATVTAVMKGDMPKLPAAVADAMNGASPLLASTVVRLKADLEEMTMFRDRAVERLERFAKDRDAARSEVEQLRRERDINAQAVKRCHEALDGIGAPGGAALVGRMQEAINELVAERDAALAEVEALRGKVAALEGERADVLAAKRERDEINEECDRCARRYNNLVGLLQNAECTAGLTWDERSSNAEDCVKALTSWISDAVGGGERASKYVERLGLDVGERYTLMMVVRAMVERIDELNQEKNDLEAERDAFALALARLVSKT